VWSKPCFASDFERVRTVLTTSSYELSSGRIGFFSKGATPLGTRSRFTSNIGASTLSSHPQKEAATTAKQMART
ncbi:MAG: hypothetical protein NXI22_21010, partial [bacterium]|nr:hypothetical protein [bacterium]